MSDPTKVTTRILDWAELVKRAWGPEWSEPETALEFSNGRKFNDSGRNGGLYSSSLDAIDQETLDLGNQRYSPILNEDFSRILQG